jgi:hypothetical protein
MSSSISSSDGAWRRFFRLAAGTAAAITAIIYGFVVLVDPFDALPFSLPLDRAPVTSNQRFDYPALARSPRFDSVVIGTSSSRLLRPSALNESFRARFANLAMNDATPYEQMRLMTVFLRAHPAAAHIILGIDMKWCETGDNIAKLTPRQFPEWMYEESAWSGYREMLNMFAIQEAAKEFGVLAGLKREDQGRDGYTIFVPPDESYDRVRAAAHLREDGPAMPPGTRAGPPASWRFSAFDDLRPLLAALPDDTDAIMYFVPSNRVRLPPPDHPAAEVWAECKRRAVRVARAVVRPMVVDFLLPSPITNNDDGYWDSQHYRVAVADLVVRDLAAASRGASSPDYQILYVPGR